MFARTIGTTVIAQYAGIFLAMLTSIIINRSLGPEGKGSLAQFMTAFSIVILFGSFGLFKSYTYEISFSKSSKEIIANAVGQGFVVGLIVALITLPLLVVQLGNETLSQYSTALLLLAIFTTATVTLSSAGNAILRGMNRIDECNIGSLLYHLLYLVFNLIGALTVGLSVETVILFYLLAQTAGVIYYLLKIRSATTALRLQWKAQWRFIRYGMRYQVYSAFNALHQQVDIILLGWMLVAQVQIGYYATAVGLVQMLWQIPNAVTMVLFPYVAAQPKDDAVSIRTAQLCRLSTLTMAAAGIGMALFAAPVITLLYGEAYLPATTPLLILLPGIISVSVSRIAGGHLMGRNKLWSMTVITIIVMVLNVALNYVLVPVIGVNGAALASTVTYTINAVLTAWLLSREGHVSILDTLIPRPADITLLLTGARRVAQPVMNRLSAGRSRG